MLDVNYIKRVFVRSIVIAIVCGVANVAEAATVRIVPQEQTVYVGDTVKVDILLDTDGELLNAGDIIVTYDTTILEAKNVTRGNSIFTLWTEEPRIENGSVSFQGGKPLGFSGENNIIGQVLFTVMSPGITTLTFNDETRVLKHDGLGSKADLRFASAIFTTAEFPDTLPVLISTSHAESGVWYPKETFIVSWDTVEDADYSYLITQDPFAEADTLPDDPVGKIKFTGLTDGTWYFTLRTKLPDEAWSPSIRYLVLNDRTLPHEFSIERARDPLTVDGNYFISFSTTDDISGISHYEIREGEEAFHIELSPYVLKDQKLRSGVEVRAYDHAGNYTSAYIAPVPRDVTIYYVIAGALVIFILIILVVIWRYRRRHVEGGEERAPHEE